MIGGMPDGELESITSKNYVTVGVRNILISKVIFQTAVVIGKYLFCFIVQNYHNTLMYMITIYGVVQCQVSDL